MEEELDIFNKMALAENLPDEQELYSFDICGNPRILNHRNWLESIRKERPNPEKHFNVGVYIRYFNQTKHKNYLTYHLKQYEKTFSLCPNWNVVGFYIDEGSTAPNMESAPNWSRLLDDCFQRKVDLIITQKISNVSRKPYEITLVARILASLNPPIGIYFISEDVFTLASYYQHDLHDTYMFPDDEWELLPDDEDDEVLSLLEDMTDG